MVFSRRQWPAVLLLFSFIVPACLPGFAQSTQTNKPSTSTKKQTSKPTSKAKKAPVRKRNSPRLRRMRQAFVASTSLKPMARQLLQRRTPAAYAGVEGFARKHASEDAGALAWLVAGYARTLDHDWPKAMDALVRAKPQAGDLGDYVTYYLSSAYQQTGRNPEAIANLSEFDKNYPDSLLLRDARVLEANALIADNRAAEAVALLEKDRLPTRADLELALGRAYAATKQFDRAITTLRNIYIGMPLSYEASVADTELAKLNTSAVPITYDQRKIRADLLLRGRRYGDAADEYHGLINGAPADQRPVMQLATADALRRAGRNREAKQLVEQLGNLTPDLNAQRIFTLGEISRAANEDDTFLKDLAELRQTAPNSPYLEQALLSAGNIYLLRKDVDRAIDSYRETQQRFPNGARASYAHWKVAWLSLRQGRNAEARDAFEQQIALYPSSAEVPAALYWRARLAEEENDPATARAYYQKLSQRFRNYYYGEEARQRLAKLHDPNPPAVIALLDRVPPFGAAPKTTLDEVPTGNLRVEKAELLENGALVDFAVRELQAAATEEAGNWPTAEIARLYQDAGRYDMAIETLKRAVPNYFALDLPTLPRPYWEALFPKAYWPDLKTSSSANGLDPYLVASLVRQESAFNPAAVSKANAVGLMQLLPKVGKSVARSEKLKGYNAQQLFTPAVNLKLGPATSARWWTSLAALNMRSRPTTRAQTA